MQDRNRATRAPRLRVFNEEGKEIFSTVNPEDVLFSFIHVQYGEERPKWSFYGVRLLIDDVEYNPPIHYVKSREDTTSMNIKTEEIEEARRKLLYLIDLHKAFYG